VPARSSPSVQIQAWKSSECMGAVRKYRARPK
jgi:hypothetical protein